MYVYLCLGNFIVKNWDYAGLDITQLYQICDKINILISLKIVIKVCIRSMESMFPFSLF
jgi:hypothetical protein